MPLWAFAGCPPQTTMIWRQYRVTGDASGGGGAGANLSNVPFVTWDFNASLDNETPVWALTRSVVPAPASNKTVSIGNSTYYWLGVHALTGFFPTLCLNGDCRTAWPSSTGEVYNGTFNETEGIYIYNSTNWKIDFNETKLNLTINSSVEFVRANFSNMETGCNPGEYAYAKYNNGSFRCRADTQGVIVELGTSANVVCGTLVSGTISDTYTINQVYYQVQETAPAGCGLEAYVNFTTVPGGEWRVHFVGRYQGGGTHNLTVMIYNYSAAAWYEWTTLFTSATDQDSTSIFFSSDDFINASGAASVAFKHSTATYVNAHNVYVDYLVLEKQGSITHHDDLANLNWSVAEHVLDADLIPHPSHNSTLSLGNATNYFSAVHASNGFFSFLSVSQQLNALNASFAGNVSVAENLSVGGNLSAAGNLTASSATFVFQSSFRAYNSSDLSIPSLYFGDAKIWWDTENWDVRGEFDNSATSRFTANMTGKYHACAALTCGVFERPCVLMSLSIYKNWFGAALGFGTTYYVNYDNFLEVCDDFDLAAGDYLEVWASGAPADGDPEGCLCWAETEKSFFAVHKVS